MSWLRKTPTSSLSRRAGSTSRARWKRCICSATKLSGVDCQQSDQDESLSPTATNTSTVQVRDSQNRWKYLPRSFIQTFSTSATKAQAGSDILDYKDAKARKQFSAL